MVWAPASQWPLRVRSWVWPLPCWAATVTVSLIATPSMKTFTWASPCQLSPDSFSVIVCASVVVLLSGGMATLLASAISMTSGWSVRLIWSWLTFE